MQEISFSAQFYFFLSSSFFTYYSEFEYGNYCSIKILCARSRQHLQMKDIALILSQSYGYDVSVTSTTDLSEKKISCAIICF